MNKHDTPSSKSSGDTHQGTFLPQFTRLFSASHLKSLFSFATKGLTWALLFFLIVANAALSQSNLVTSIENKLRRITDDNTKLSNVLGITKAKDEDSPTISDLENQYNHWNNIVEELPDYRDGHFILATLAYQMGDFELSRNHLMKVKDMDPNFPGLSQLEELLKQE